MYACVPICLYPHMHDWLAIVSIINFIVFIVYFPIYKCIVPLSNNIIIIIIIACMTLRLVKWERIVYTCTSTVTYIIICQ